MGGKGAVHEQRVPVYEGGLRAAEPERGIGHFCRRAEAPGRDVAEQFCGEGRVVLEQGIGHGRFDGTGAKGIYADVLRRVIDGRCPCQADDGVLAGDIGGLPGKARDTAL